MNIKITTVFTVMVLLPGIGYSQTFCYYWAANDGTITSYTRPPVDISYTTLDYPTGRVIIASPAVCENGKVIVKGPTEQAVSAPAQQALAQESTPSRSPQPVAVERNTEAAPAEVNLNPATEVNLNPSEVNLRPREERAQPVQ